MFTNYLLLVFCFLAILSSIMIIVSKNPIHSILYLILVFCNITFVLIIMGVEFIAIIFLIVYVGAIAVLFLFVVMMLNIKILELDEVFWKYIPIGLLISSCFLLQIFYFVFDFGALEAFSLFFSNSPELLSKISVSSKFSSSFYDSNLLVNGFYSVKASGLVVNSDLICFLYTSPSFCFTSENSYALNNLGLSFELTNTEILGWLVYTYTFFIFLIVSVILLVSMIGSIILVLNQNINIKRQLIFRQTLRDLKSSVLLKKDR